MADELESQVDASVTETPSEAAAPVDSTPDLSAGEGTITSTPETEWTGVRDYLKSAGIAADAFEDDEAAIKHLAERAKQYEQVAPYYQQVAPHWTEFQKWRAQQQQQVAPPPQPAPEQKKYWEPLPELDQAWLHMVARDPGTGQIVVKPEYRGAVAPDLPQKVQAYLQAKQERESKLLNDPYAAIRPAFEQDFQKVREEIEALRRERAQEQNNQFVNGYLQQNAQWLFQMNEQGQRLQNVDGTPALTPTGNAFRGYLAEAAQMQMPEQAALRYAEMATRAWMSQQPQPAAQAKPKGTFLNRIANRSGTVASEQDGIPQDAGLSIGEKLKRALVAAGHDLNGNG